MPSRRLLRRKDAERVVEEVRDDDPELARYLRIEEREPEACGSHERTRRSRWELSAHLALT